MTSGTLVFPWRRKHNSQTCGKCRLNRKKDVPEIEYLGDSVNESSEFKTFNHIFKYRMNYAN